LFKLDYTRERPVSESGLNGERANPIYLLRFNFRLITLKRPFQLQKIWMCGAFGASRLNNYCGYFFKGNKGQILKKFPTFKLL